MVPWEQIVHNSWSDTLSIGLSAASIASLSAVTLTRIAMVEPRVLERSGVTQARGDGNWVQPCYRAAMRTH